MRFDDSLRTVLSADMSPGFGAVATWRQLVDLLGRGRVDADETLIARLRLLRQAVPIEVRAASGRALAFAAPGPALVGLFAEDELSVAAPVLRTATLDGEAWIALLPRLAPAQRAVLRHRRDLPAEVTRALESFGSVDFVLEGAAAPVAVEPVEETPPAVPPSTPLDATPFVALGDVARGLPVVAEALRRAEEPETPATNGFAISDLVARIEAFNRGRIEPAATPAAPQPAATFRFETDAAGIVRQVDGAARAALVGLSLSSGAPQGIAQVDGAVAGAFRRRARFADARLHLGGTSDAAGSWRVSGVPLFDADTGRFTGFAGSARRPRPDETAEPQGAAGRATADSLRQLVHELRTPTNAIAGFAELIESELLGPISPTYKARAATIRAHAADLLVAIEDLDTAARIEAQALDLREDIVDPAALLSRVVADVEPLAALRGAAVRAVVTSAVRPVAADRAAVERLVNRLAATAVSGAAPGETVSIRVRDEGADVTVAVDRPTGIVGQGDAEATLLSLDAAEANGDGAPGAPLLGVGFSLRLVRNLAAEIGGSLSFEPDCLTLRLPAALDQRVEQATTL